MNLIDIKKLKTLEGCIFQLNTNEDVTVHNVPSIDGKVVKLFINNKESQIKSSLVIVNKIIKTKETWNQIFVMATDFEVYDFDSVKTKEFILDKLENREIQDIDIFVDEVNKKEYPVINNDKMIKDEKMVNVFFTKKSCGRFYSNYSFLESLFEGNDYFLSKAFSLFSQMKDALDNPMMSYTDGAYRVIFDKFCISYMESISFDLYFPVTKDIFENIDNTRCLEIIKDCLSMSIYSYDKYVDFLTYSPNAKKSALVGEVNKKELKNSIGKFKNFLLEITEEIAINN